MTHGWGAGVAPQTGPGHALAGRGSPCWRPLAGSSSPIRWFARFVVLVTLVTARTALAAGTPSPLELLWSGPPECPSGQSVEKEALRLAATDRSALPRVHANVIIERKQGSEYVLVLTTRASGPDSIQTLRAGTCRAVAQAAAVTLALLLNPASAPGPAAPRDEAVPTRQARSTGPSLPTRWAAAGFAGVQFGLLPRIGPIVGAEAGLARGRASAWLGGAYGPSQREILDGPPDLGGELSLGGAFFYGCWRVAGRAPELNVCGGLDFNHVWGRGVGVANERADAITWFSALGGAVAQLSLSTNILVRIAALGSAPFTRPAAYIESAGTVHEPGRINGRLHAALGAVVP